MRDCLTENGFGDADADTLIRTAVSATRSETRSQGFRRFVAGLIMLGAGGLSAIVLLTGVRSGIVAFGVLIFLGGGTLATLSGIYSMLTGRESETAGNFVIRFEE